MTELLHQLLNPLGVRLDPGHAVLGQPDHAVGEQVDGLPQAANHRLEDVEFLATQFHDPATD